MIKPSRMLLCTLLFLSLYHMNTYALPASELYSRAAVLIDAGTGQVLFDKNMNELMYPASTTKIMTGIVAIEKCFPGEILTVSGEAVDIAEPMSSNISLTLGEELTFDSAMYAMMLHSANDAANVIAEHVAGSQAEFAVMMTEKARMIGAANTNFTNAHGLHDPDHYTTAYDLALITRYAAGNRNFMRYFGADIYDMPATKSYASERPLSNYQYMLIKTSQFYNEDVTGGKVGYTTPAGHTMSTVATRDGRTLICVVMGSANRNEKFNDTKKLFDFGFDEFITVTIPRSDFGAISVPVLHSGAMVGDVLLRPGSDFTFLLHNSVEPSSVRFSYETPDYYEHDIQFGATVTLTAETQEDFVPSVLLTAALIPEMHDKFSPASVKVDIATKPAVDDYKWNHFPLLGLCLLTLALLVCAARSHRLKKRRKEQLIRINNRLCRSGREDRSTRTNIVHNKASKKAEKPSGAYSIM